MPEVPKAVFLSHASQDAEAARRICETLHDAGVEAWLVSVLSDWSFVLSVTRFGSGSVAAAPRCGLRGERV